VSSIEREAEAVERQATKTANQAVQTLRTGTRRSSRATASR